MPPVDDAARSADPLAETPAARHLRVLREILARDYLSAPDFASALSELATSVKRSLGAQEAMVAVWDEASGSWEAFSTGGVVMRDDAIERLGSRSTLDRVRATGKPVLATGDEALTLSSPSIRRRRISGLLVVPLAWWDLAEPRARSTGACIYAHRTLGRAPFGFADVDLVLDIARLAEPVVNLLRHVREVERRLSISELELDELRQRGGGRPVLGEEDLALPPRVLETLRRIVKSPRVSLLITGPTGSGKSLLARAYHDACPRREKTFVVLDCGSVTAAETLGAELFGYAPRSGFANAPKGGAPGKAALAHGGTLFVDEIGNLAPELQPKLLRLLQEGRYSPLGTSREESVDIQVIAATNADLESRVRAGAFREDLYHRLNVVRVSLPGLGERTEEIPRIAGRLLQGACREAGRDAMTLARDAMGALMRHDWEADGNIRGLENLIRRSVWAAPEGKRRLSAADLFWNPRERPVAAGGTDARAPAGRRRRLSAASAAWRDELARVKAAIRQHGNGSSAASALGLSYRQLYWTLQRAGLTIERVLGE